MCEVCGHILDLISKYANDQDAHEKPTKTISLSKQEVLNIVSYPLAWSQRQCMCCYKETRNYEIISTLVQHTLSVVIHALQELGSSSSVPSCSSVQQQSQPEVVCVEDDEDGSNGSACAMSCRWNTAEMERLLAFASTVFIINFPLYLAYKHHYHPMGSEELSQQEAAILASYCDVSDAEGIPVSIFRNVCFFCDSNGLQAIHKCFNGCSTDALPIPLVHCLVSIVSNVRSWLVPTAIQQHLMPLKPAVVSFMCKLTDDELRQAGNRSLTDALWSALKEPIFPPSSVATVSAGLSGSRGHSSGGMPLSSLFDSDLLSLAFKYFTSSTLTLRLAGIGQINNHIATYNEAVHSDGSTEVEKVAVLLVQWLLDNKIVEHIFGPNIHIEIIRQSQLILNLLAAESCLTDEHIDAMWQAALLKHCGRQVQDLLQMLMKSLSIRHVTRLARHVAALEPSAQTNHTLVLSSVITKVLWTVLSSRRGGSGGAGCSSSSSGSKEALRMPVLLSGSGSDSARVGGPGARSSQRRGAGVQLHRRLPMLVHDSSLDRDLTTTDETETSDEEQSVACCSSTKQRRLAAAAHLSSLSVKSVRSRTVRRKRLLFGPQRRSAELAAMDPHVPVTPTSASVDRSSPSLPKHQADVQPSAIVSGPPVPEAVSGRGVSPSADVADSKDCPGPSETLAGASCIAGTNPATTDALSAAVSAVVAASRAGSTRDTSATAEPEASVTVAGGASTEDSRDTHQQLPMHTTQDAQPQLIPVTVEKHFHPPEPSTSAATAVATGPSSDNGSASDAGVAPASDDDGDEDMLPSDMEDGAGLRTTTGIPAMFVAAAVSAAADRTVTRCSRRPKGKLLFKQSRPACKDQDAIREPAPSEDESMGSSCELDEKFLDAITSASGGASVEKAIAEIRRHKNTSAVDDIMLPMLTTDKKGSSSCTPRRLPHRALRASTCEERQREGIVRHDELDDDDMEDDEEENDSCASSQMSAKSEKNMADFEGEDLISDEELSHIHRQACSELVLSPSAGEQLDLRMDDVCQPGRTLLWDLIQDDKAQLLPDGLVMEAEKALCNILCYAHVDKELRRKFIEACIHNLAANRSVVMSLRMLPKLLNSFQQPRNNAEVHNMTMWAERELNMMNVFFKNLILFRQTLDDNGPDRAFSMYGLKEEVRVRLSFLNTVFSSAVSPPKFQLSRQHVEILWSCLATHPLTSDPCLNWFGIHAKNRQDHHALDFDSLKYLFVDKMSTLQPESVSMVGIALYQQLHHVMQAIGIGRDRISSTSSGEQVCAGQLWDIALKAKNNDVSQSAVDYLNLCYIACGDLEKEEEFVSRCMGSLLEALENVKTSGCVGSNLLAIERGLHLLKAHLESFRQRYAYALRSWQLEVGGIASHQRASQDRGAPVLRLVISAAGLSSLTGAPCDKINVEVHSSDYLGEFRAEITKWWQNLVGHHRKSQLQPQESTGLSGGSTSGRSPCAQLTVSPDRPGAMPSAGGAQSPAIISCLLGSGGPIRIITNGQELTADHDCKTLTDLQFKDGQTVFVSVYSGRQVKSRTGNTDGAGGSATCLSPISTTAAAAAPSGELTTRGRIPMLILLQQPHFDNLFNLLKQLSCPDQIPSLKDADEDIKCHARGLSRKVWDLLMMLPTNSTALCGLSGIAVQWPTSPLPAAPWLSQPSTAMPSALGSCGDGATPSFGCGSVGSVGSATAIDWQKLLDASCAPKLLYCLQIVEALSANGAAAGPAGRRLPSLSSGRRRRSAALLYQPKWPPAATLLASSPQTPQKLHGGSSLCGTDVPSAEGSCATETAEEMWSRQFVSCGGLRRLFDIFVSGCLQARDGEVWGEWSQEALAYLLRLMIQFSTAPSDLEQSGATDRRTPSEFSKKKLKKPRLDNVIVPVLNQELVPILRSRHNEVLHILTTVVKDAAAVRLDESAEKSTGNYGCVTAVSSRAEVVHFALSFLVSWAFADNTLKDTLASHPEYSSWIKSVTLVAPESEIRLEACRGIYRLCLGRSADGAVSGHVFLPAMLLLLLDHLPEAVRMKPYLAGCPGQVSEPGKAKDGVHLGSASSEYLWLLCRLVDGLAASAPQLPSTSSATESPSSTTDASMLLSVSDRLNVLCHSLAEFIAAREFYESRHNNPSEDDGLRSLLELLTSVLKQNPRFKFSIDGQKLVDAAFSYLFALPTMQHRSLPKCKSHASRSAAYDVLVELAKGCVENYGILHRLLLEQHRKDSHSPYPWDYWPQDDVRSSTGFIGLTNLGATCYMATCMQHLYMIPQARRCILEVERKSVKDAYQPMLAELQKMFAYLLESERKAYNPRSFCKSYTMHQQPLNTGEQKDMTEFFTDLIGKLEEMSPDLKKMVKGLFGGVLSNNVVSRDCSHISRTLEEFYTVRCQVADMKSLYESLDEICVKDVLEGDNMYTCSQCQKKVRAEKRACFKKLPHILCFNTMRYTFNMVTMQKEKINTLFSFPIKLDMSDYMEEKLLQSCEGSTPDYHDSNKGNSGDGIGGLSSTAECDPLRIDDDETASTEYELIGVTVHTGNADGGHYYSFIRDRMDRLPDKPDKWYLFNDAEVKPFDPAQLSSECFGGEATSKTYDTITEKFMDFSYEKTNSAYMLFYERVPRSSVRDGKVSSEDGEDVASASSVLSLSQVSLAQDTTSAIQLATMASCHDIKLPSDLAEWIWHDNMEFLHDKNIFDSTYIGFMFQMCGYIPTTLAKPSTAFGQNQSAVHSAVPEVVVDASPAASVHLSPAVQLTASFLLETFIHAREKPNMVQWMELLTKQFNQCHDACEWFLRTMARDDWWPQQILISCPNQVVRQMFQRLVIHVISQLRPNHCKLYLAGNCQHAANVNPAAALSAPTSPSTSTLTIETTDEASSLSRRTAAQTGEAASTAPAAGTSCSVALRADGIQSFPSVVAQFIAKMLRLVDSRCSGSRQSQSSSSQCASLSGSSNTGKYMSEFFSLLLDFAKLGEEEKQFLLSIGAISRMVAFYMGTVNDDTLVEIGSDDDDDTDFLAMPETKLKVASLEKMIHLISMLVEHSRDECGELELSAKDRHSLVGGKGFPFIISQIRDNINLKQTCNLILSLTRWDDTLATDIVTALFGAITRFGSVAGTGDSTQPYFKVLSMLTELAGTGPPGTPAYTHLVLVRIWEVIEHCAQPCLEWLATLVCRQTSLAAVVLQHLDAVVEPFLMAHSSPRVRNAASLLLVSLVPSHSFRQAARNVTRSALSPHKELLMAPEALHVLHIIYKHLLGLLCRAKAYVDVTTYGVTNLVAYFSLLTMCLVSRAEKLMFTPYFIELWHVYQPKMTEPPISINHNKQALLSFWYHACIDCTENVKLITSNPMVCKNIAFNYILADHEDQDIMLYNRCMLPSYYGLLRLCCQRSRPFTRQLAQHQNILWALQHITPFASHYPLATEELFRLMQLMVTVYPDSTDEELKAVQIFKRKTIEMYRQTLNARSDWQTFVNVMKIILEKDEEKLHCLAHDGLHMCTEAFGTLHAMYHEATACHVVGELVDLLTIFASLVRTAKSCMDSAKEAKTALVNWKEKIDVARHCLTLLHSYSPPELRQSALDLLRELVLLCIPDLLYSIVAVLAAAHSNFQEASAATSSSASTMAAYAYGPYFPRRGHKASAAELRLAVRPPRPQFGMFLNAASLEAKKGSDVAYDQALTSFFVPYYLFVDVLVRVAVNQKMVRESLVTLSAIVAYESVPLHTVYFPKLWCEIYCAEAKSAELTECSYVRMLCHNSYLVDYMDSILNEERVALNNQHIYQFFCYFFPKVHKQVLTERAEHCDELVNSIVDSLLQLECVRAECGTGDGPGSCEPDKLAVDIHRLASRANADLRALLIIYSVASPIQPVDASATSAGNATLGKLQRCVGTVEWLCSLHRTQQQQRLSSAEVAGEAVSHRPSCESASDDSASCQAASDSRSEDREDEHATPTKRRRMEAETVASGARGRDSAHHMTAPDAGASMSSGTTMQQWNAPSQSQQIQPLRTREGKVSSNAADDRAADHGCGRSGSSSSSDDASSDSSECVTVAAASSAATQSVPASSRALARPRLSAAAAAAPQGSRKPMPADLLSVGLKSFRDMLARLTAPSCCGGPFSTAPASAVPSVASDKLPDTRLTGSPAGSS